VTETLEFARAAQLLRTHRETILKGEVSGDLARVSPARQHVDAGLTGDGILLITGSNNWQDYLFYNLRPFRPLPRLAAIDRITRVLKRRYVHKGFLLHAARVLTFLGTDTPRFITGHSLGAGAAQILGTVLRVPTLCFASPQVVSSALLQEAPYRDPGHAQWQVFNVAWEQDYVTKGYRNFGMRALGYREVIDLGKWNRGIDHFLEDYEALLHKDAISPTRRVPPQWLHPSRPIVYS